MDGAVERTLAADEVDGEQPFDARRIAQQAAGAPDRGHGLGREQGVELGSDFGRFPDPQNLREIDGIMRDHSIGRHRD